MTLRDTALAALTAVIWGLGFVAIKFGLESFSPAQLTALRFIIACLPVLVVPRPPISWPMLVAIGLTLFTGQFLLLFFAYVEGLPPGVAAVTQQIQVFFTVALAAIFLRDTATRRQWIGMLVAFCGLALIGLTVGGDLTPSGFALAMAAAFSWAVGNILIKRVGKVPMLPLMTWLSLVPPLPALLVSSLDDRAPWIFTAVLGASWTSIVAAVYLAVLATTVAYAMWGHLLARYPSAVVAPFALLAPCAGIASSALVFGESFPPLRYFGMALIFAGLAVVFLPASGALLTGKNRRHDQRDCRGN